jgi:thiol-disulfide isomerase/thioredoxin
MKSFGFVLIILLPSMVLSAQSVNEEGFFSLPDFELRDMNHNMFSSDSLEGKYLIIDFWASWCGPCHKKFPLLREIYDEYHEKGLEIVGISTDLMEDAWLADVKRLQLPWVQLLDRQGPESVAVSFFKVKSLPALFFIYPDGHIVIPGNDFNEIRGLLANEFPEKL